MRGVEFAFHSYDELLELIRLGAEERSVALRCADGLREGEWLLVAFEVGEECLSLAGQMNDLGDGAKVTFEERDWRRLAEFAAAEHCPASSRPSAQFPACALHVPPNTRVLLVDDDQELQKVLCCMLRAKGFHVVAVGNAEDAFPIVRSRAVDLLVLDGNLPGMSGTDFLQRLRGEPCCAELPVLFLSANTTTEDMLDALSAGADDFVAKPFRVPELGARILGLLRRAVPTQAAG